MVTKERLIEKLNTLPAGAVINTVHLSNIIDLNPNSWMLVDEVIFEPDTKYNQPNGFRIIFQAN
jgi:hypothetical protein